MCLGHSLKLRSSVLILLPLLVVSALAVIWRFDNARATTEDTFGIQFGQRQREQLETTIQKRSTTDLDPIERETPREATGSVGRLKLFINKLTEAQATKDRLNSSTHTNCEILSPQSTQLHGR